MKTSKAIDVCAITIWLLILGGCNSIKKEPELDYNFKKFDIPSDEIVGGHTLMELETGHYKSQYDEKKSELKKAYDEFVKCHRGDSRLQTMEEQEKEFEHFIESYAEKQPCLSCRASWYHHYGHLIDMIDLRIKHLRIHTPPSGGGAPEQQCYNLKTFDISDDELVGHTFAELENKEYTKQYDEKKIELKKAYDEFVKCSGREDAAADQQKEFERFIESYAKKNQCMYLRSAWYHYCGALVDMIDLRIKHLKIYTAWFSY